MMDKLTKDEFRNMKEKMTQSQQNFIEKCNSSVGPRTEAQKRRAKITSEYINREVEKRLKEFEKKNKAH